MIRGQLPVRSSTVGTSTADNITPLLARPLDSNMSESRLSAVDSILDGVKTQLAVNTSRFEHLLHTRYHRWPVVARRRRPYIANGCRAVGDVVDHNVRGTGDDLIVLSRQNANESRESGDQEAWLSLTDMRSTPWADLQLQAIDR